MLPCTRHGVPSDEPLHLGATPTWAEFDSAGPFSISWGGNTPVEAQPKEGRYVLLLTPREYGFATSFQFQCLDDTPKMGWVLLPTHYVFGYMRIFPFWKDGTVIFTTLCLAVIIAVINLALTIASQVHP